MKFSVIVPVYNVADYLKNCKKPVLPYQGEENYAKAYNEFYESFLEPKQ